MWRNFLVSAFALPLAAHAATNGLDDRFGTHGVALLGAPPAGAAVSAYGLTLQSDGKIVVAGRTGTTPTVGRLLADGSWDTGFGTNGVFLLPGTLAVPNGGVMHNVSVLSDGRILASGAANDASHYRSCILLLELSAAGVPENTFAPDGSGSFCTELGTPQSVLVHDEAMRVDSDDSFFLTMASAATNYGVVGRFDANGTPVGTFGTNGLATLPAGAYGSQLQLLPNHALLVVSIDEIGSPAVGSGIESSALDASGQIVASYGSGGSIAFDIAANQYTSPMDVALDTQGRLVIADDDSTITGGQNYPYRIARLSPAGALDGTFNAAGQQGGSAGFAVLNPSGYVNNYDYLLSVKPLPDGHLMAIGNTASVTSGDATSNLALLRLKDDAAYDPAFGDAAHPGWTSINIGGSSSSDTYVRAATQDAAGRLYVLAATIDSNAKGCMAIVRLLPDRLFADAFDTPPAFPNCP